MPLLALPLSSGAYGTASNMPTIYLEWSPTTGPRDVPIWERIPLADIRSIDINRGRNRELDQFQAGRMTVVLDNRHRLYDPMYSAGANFGNVKPMRRIRLRAAWDNTYDLFTGFVDGWDQNYDMTDEATCTVIATDGFKVLENWLFERSVYDEAVLDDEPDIYWKFDEVKTAAQDSTLVAKNKGTLGTAGNGTYVGPPVLGGEALVVGDAGTSMGVVSSDSAAGTTDMGVRTEADDFSLIPTIDASFVVELWCIPNLVPGAQGTLISQAGASGTIRVHVWFSSTNKFTTNVFSGGTDQSVTTNPTTFEPHARHHIVVKVVPGETVKMWVDGTLFDDSETALDHAEAPGALDVGHIGGFAGSLSWDGQISHFAVWRGEGAEAFGAANVAAHLEAGTAPWNGDLTGARIERLLDFFGWPSADRDIDEGESTLQSADIAEKTALAHAQLVRDTEYGELFIAPNGNVRFIGRHNKWLPPYSDPLFTLSDDGSDLSYGRLKFNYDDQLIRNRVTVGYDNGLVFTANSTSSQDDFLIKSYSKTSLIGDVDSEAVDYANYILGRYDEPLLRVEGISITPQKNPTVMWPAVLAADLVYQVNVERTPQGVGTAIDQDYTIEGVSHHIEPKFWRTELQLSPADTPGAFILDSTSQGILDTNTLGW